MKLCKLVLEGVYISHFFCLGKTSNSRYKYSGLLQRPKILLYLYNSPWVQNSVFPNRKNVFPDSLQNSENVW